MQSSSAATEIHPDRLYSIREVAGHLGISETSVYRMTSNGVLRKTRIGPRAGRVKVRGRDLLRYIELQAA